MLKESLDFASKLARSYRIQVMDREDLIQELLIVSLKVSRLYQNKREEEVARIARFAMRRRAKKFIHAKMRREKKFLPLKDDMDFIEKPSLMPQIKLELETSKLPSSVSQSLLEGFSIRETAERTGLKTRSLYREIYNFGAI